MVRFIDIDLKTEEFLKEANAYEIPVTFSKIRKHYDIEMVEVDFSQFPNKIEGAIVKENGKVKIYVEKKNHINRKRFTLAHELGHFVYEMENGLKDYQEVYFRSEKFSESEARADYFAASLLMPITLITNEFNEVQEKIKKNYNYMDMKERKEITIDFLAQKFRVSTATLIKRLAELDLM